MSERLWVLGAATAIFVLPCPAQRILYNGERDAQAQTAVAAAKNVASAGLFETQLRNLDQLSRQQLETMLKWQEVQMRTSLNRFTTWADVRLVLKRVDDDLVPFLDDDEKVALIRAGEITKRCAVLKAQIEAMKDAAHERSPILDQLFSHLGQSDEILKFADSALAANPARVQALNEIVATLEQVGKLYTSVQGMIAAKAAVSVPISSLRPNPLETELQLLKVEEQHWKALGLIRARRALEVGEIKLLVDSARSRSAGFPAGEKIEQTFERLRSAQDPDRQDKLELAIYAVHGAAAVAAQQATCARLAELRTTIEVRRYSIQQSAVNAGVYEQTARAASDRLAIYWKAGIRPKDLAELMLHLSTAVSLPIIAVK